MLVNATMLTQTVSLGELLRHISGTQVPAVNDGQWVGAVTLPPHDGIILLRAVEPRLYLPIVLRSR